MRVRVRVRMRVRARVRVRVRVRVRGACSSEGVAGVLGFRKAARVASPPG